MINTDVVRTAQQTHSFSVKNTNTPSGQEEECQNAKFGGTQRKGTTGPCRVAVCSCCRDA